jgi:ribosomal protein S18 acetylase RimI-like enzyme
MILDLDVRDPAVAEEVHALHLSAYAVEWEWLGRPDFPPLRVTLDHLRAEPGTFLGEREGDRLVGVLTYTEDGAELDIGRLVVDPDRFRRGIGARLVAEAVHRAHGRPVTVSTGAENPAALALYARFGFVEAGRHTFPDGLVVVRLRRDRG